MSFEGRDRRAHPRLATATSAIVLARHNDGVPLTIVSLSLSGARLIGEITLAVGEQVDVLFEIDGHPVDVTGEVVRATKLDIATDEVAVRFLAVTDAARQLIREAVARSLEREYGD
jgi:hypothetical protein